MSVFVPFKAIRPKADSVKAVASRPYDVLNAHEARDEAEGNPISFYHVTKPEIDFSEDFDPHAHEIYKKGKENFDNLVHRGILQQDDQECFYVYQLTMNGHTQVGLVGCCAIDDYFNKVIKVHEFTRSEKEEDRKNHILLSKLHYEPVLFAYHKVSAIDDIVKGVVSQSPIYDFVADDGIRHQIWVIDQPEILEKISATFSNEVSSIYIADGHHRTAASSSVGQELRNARNGDASDGGRDNYFMAVLFPDNQLKILDYNRVVKDLNGLTEDELMILLAKDFRIEPKESQYRPESVHTFGMYLNHRWFKLTAKSGTYDETDPFEQLDVTILSKNILEPLFNIIDLRKDTRIDFVGGMRGLGELEKRVDSGEMKIAFSMFPVSMQQLFDISDHDLIMPPKVTWFEPKLRSGLLVHKIDE